MSDHLPPLSAIRVFEAAARHLSFTRAAVELSMTQAAVSYQIKVLEELEDLFVVKGALTEQDKIIFEGQRQAHDGQKAPEYRFEETKDAYANLKLHAQ